MDKIIDNTTGFHFTIVDNYILDCASLNAVEQVVYIHLKKYAQQSNKCFPGVARLAEDAASSANTIRKVLKSLRAKGLIDIQQRINASNEYTLLPYPEFAKEAKEEGCRDDGNSGIGAVLEAYQNNINPAYGSMEREKLMRWLEMFEGRGEIIIKAIEISVLQGVRKIKYIETVLLHWHNAGIKTLEQCEAHLKQWEEKRREGKNGYGVCGASEEPELESRYDFSKFDNL